MPPRVFLSYAQVPEDHKQRVAELAASLKAAGLDVVYDGDVTSPQGPPEGLPQWMLDQIEQADWVLVICNEAYYRRFRGKETPGVGLGSRWEGAIIGQALYNDGAVNRKFIPVLLGDDQPAHIPEPLRSARWYRLPAEFPRLAAALTGSPITKPEGKGRKIAQIFREFRSARKLLYAMFALVVLMGLLLWKSEFLARFGLTNFPLTVSVHDEAGPQDLILRGQGSILLDLGTDRRQKPIDDNGQVFFPEIPASFRGQTVNVMLDASGYELVNPRPRKLDGPNLYLAVRRKPGRIAGRVQDEAGNPLTGASIDIAGISAITDHAGRFEVTIPADRLQSELSLQITAQGYTTWHSLAVPGSNELKVQLSRP
ncbi:MAG TPA: SEFIR domain-containing protein [Thermoanaerobaculia bacterium]|jgi:hypothetical protein|nr:SEFIR domain-containing protein [Thermoanaerobaculia bacterium]